MKELSHFASIEDAVNYMIHELIATLRDGLGRMEGEERQHYTDGDLEEMRKRLADLETVVAPFLESFFKPEELVLRKPMDLSHCEGLNRYVVEYELPYSHRVQVGVFADDPDSALKRAEEAFDEGALWEDTPEMPLLYDDYEQDENAGAALVFRVVDQVEGFPEPDSSVRTIKEERYAWACRVALQKMNIARALAFANAH